MAGSELSTATSSTEEAASHLTLPAIFAGSIAGLVLLPVLVLVVLIAILPACLIALPLLAFDFWPERKKVSSPVARPDLQFARRASPA
jgi:hypothetical protein